MLKKHIKMKDVTTLPQTLTCTIFCYCVALSSKFFVGAIHTVYLLGKGLSTKEVILLQLNYSFFLGIAPKYTTKLEKRIGVRDTMSLGIISLAIYFIGCILAQDFFHFFFLQFFFAIGITLLTNCMPQRMINIVNIYAEKNSTDTYIKQATYLQGKYLSSISLMTTVLGSVWVYNYGSYYLLYILTSICILLSGILLHYLYNPSSIKMPCQEVHHNLKLNTHHSTELVYYFTTSAILAIINQPFYHLWQVFFKQAGLGNTVTFLSTNQQKYGFVFICIMVAQYFFHIIAQLKSIYRASNKILAFTLCLIILCSYTLISLQINNNLYFHLVLFMIILGSSSILSVVAENHFLSKHSKMHVTPIISQKIQISRYLSIFSWLGVLLLSHYKTNIHTIFFLSTIYSVILFLSFLFWFSELPENSFLQNLHLFKNNPIKLKQSQGKNEDLPFTKNQNI